MAWTTSRMRNWRPLPTSIPNSTLMRVIQQHCGRAFGNSFWPPGRIDKEAKRAVRMNKIPKYETNGAAERSGAARSAAHEKFNRDINPYTGLATAYPALEPLILNRPVSGAFAAHEN